LPGASEVLQPPVAVRLEFAQPSTRRRRSPQTRLSSVWTCPRIESRQIFAYIWSALLLSAAIIYTRGECGYRKKICLIYSGCFFSERSVVERGPSGSSRVAHLAFPCPSGSEKQQVGNKTYCRQLLPMRTKKNTCRLVEPRIKKRHSTKGVYWAET
jgi:hypothetical protein